MTLLQEGNRLYNEKRYSEAITVYREQLKDINIPAKIKIETLYNMGTSYIKLLNFEEASLCLIEVIKLDYDHAKAHFNLAYAYGHIGKMNKALIHFNTAWSIDNNDKECERAIDLILKNMKKENTSTTNTIIPKKELVKEVYVAVNKIRKGFEVIKYSYYSDNSVTEEIVEIFEYRRLLTKKYHNIINTINKKYSSVKFIFAE